MKEPKSKRTRIATKVIPLNDGTNTPVLVPGKTEKLADGEAALYKQAENPLGNPYKV